MDADHALSIAAGVGLAVCGLCVGIAAWKNSRGWNRPTLKPSKSDTDLTLILDNSIPSSSAMTVRRLTPPDDPTSGPSEERYA
jgi:hypothetical protein